MDSFCEILKYVIPSLITGAVAWLFFRQMVKNEESRRRFLLKRETLGQTIPLRLAAYERMTLFLERIRPVSLVARIKPAPGDRQSDYLKLLIKTIQQEYEHNLSQQIYLTSDCWNIVKLAKSRTQGLLTRIAAEAPNDPPAVDFVSRILKSDSEDREIPSEKALEYLKEEVAREF